MLLRHRPRNKDLAPCLFALTAQSNISNTKTPLGMAEYASSLGYHVVLDAAALAPTSTFSLSDHPVDAMAISFYKMFGFPTGVGALIVKRSFLVELKRPWFSGGTVDVVQVPGSIVTRAAELHEQFEVCFHFYCNESETNIPFALTRTAQSTISHFLRLQTAFAFFLHTSLSYHCDSHVFCDISCHHSCNSGTM